MDYVRAPLNPCSLETVPTPVCLSDRELVWPLILSCYQLEEDGSRKGQMQLYSVKIPDIAESLESSLPLSFGNPQQMILSTDDCSGVLDGKWARGNSGDTKYYFAAAHASGSIHIHSVQVNPDADSCKEQPFLVTEIAQTSPPSHGSKDSMPPLCLSLDWDSFIFGPYRAPSRIVASYSNGFVSVFETILDPPEQAEIHCVESFLAHELFRNPAEVWSASFVTSGSVMSGGDDGSVKLWDLRYTNRPSNILKPFQAGATCISKHPSIDHVVACGSYDETVCLYDIRNLSKPILRTPELGGGIWRIKFHPYSEDRILVGAMHGGCRVLRVYGDIQAENVYTFPASVKVKKEFVEHESMAYGADWLVCRHPTQNGYFEAAASCSFYDRSVFLWDSIM